MSECYVCWRMSVHGEGKKGRNSVGTCIEKYVCKWVLAREWIYREENSI